MGGGPEEELGERLERGMVFSGDSDGKESACQRRRLRFDPWVERSPGGGHGYPLQDSCLESSMDRGAWWATVHGIIKS